MSDAKHTATQHIVPRSEAPDGDAHDAGLAHDLGLLLARRRAIGLMAAAGAAGLLAGCDLFPAQAEPERVGKDASGGECVAHPTETAGPFPADGSNRAHGTLANVLADSGIVRSDMRPNLGSGAAADGVQLDLELKLVNVSKACAPLSGFAVYLWHCDAGGHYSIYDLPNATYLRAVGVADAGGVVRFTTIVPGCYPGRFPHMHFEVYRSLEEATSYKARLLTSQLAVPADVCKAAYGSAAVYAASIKNLERSPLDRDMIFADNTPKQLAAQTLQAAGDATSGYKASVVVGLPL